MGPGLDESVAAAPASSPFAANLRGRAKRADRKRGPTMAARTRQYLFTSESVAEGHPDKVADQIPDGVLVSDHFDLRPAAFRQRVDLRRPIYQRTAAYGHSGRDEADFSWERTEMAAALRDAAGLGEVDAGMAA
jgi:S-adenosylmethionine synthetase, N-terminal domain/S-adenosylmethionine synthetase, C-terminal domain